MENYENTFPNITSLKVNKKQSILEITETVGIFQLIYSITNINIVFKAVINNASINVRIKHQSTLIGYM